MPEDNKELEKKLKEREDKIREREIKVEKATKGLMSRLNAFESKKTENKDTSKLLSVLLESGIKNTSDLSKLLKNEKSTKGDDMDKAQLEEIINKAVGEKLKEAMEPLNEKLSHSSKAFESTRSATTLGDHIKSLGDEGKIIKNYFRNSKDDIINNFVEAREAEPSLTEGEYISRLQENLNAIIKNTSDEVAKEDVSKEASSDTDTRSLDKNTVTSESKPAEDKKVSSDFNETTKNALTKDQQDREDLIEAQNMTNAGDLK